MGDRKQVLPVPRVVELAQVGVVQDLPREVMVAVDLAVDLDPGKGIVVVPAVVQGVVQQQVLEEVAATVVAPAVVLTRCMDIERRNQKYAT